ncbi:MAG: adenylosuccinate synthetase [Myxococcales bacterium]|nr:adenylosuccinate synthetase [Polyangiaceae bacterium]MDW8248359.1 adenylosuccinate synthetase [Myxococcales bacterium]
MVRVPAASDPIAVVGLGFGDEGKGSIVDALARRRNIAAVVRFNGGPQAAHHVVTPEGQVHCFSQIGSALLADPNLPSLSTHRVLVEPLGLLREADVLSRLVSGDPLSRLHLDARSVVVTPFHRLMNRAIEVARGQGRHGSCGLGVGQAYQDSLRSSLPTVRLGDLRDPARLRRKLEVIRWSKIDWIEELQRENTSVELERLRAEMRRPDLIPATLHGYAELLHRVNLHDEVLPPRGAVLLEGAQGTLLDENYGFWPHVTPSTTTFAWADEISSEPPYRLGVLRAFSTRHGAGPLVAEGAPEVLLQGEHNKHNDWQGSFRVGWFDLVMARYALAVVGGVDGLALTCLDRLRELPWVGLVDAWMFSGDPTEAADLFNLDGQRVLGVLVAHPPCRVRQERLTRMLSQCKPLLRRLPSTHALLDTLQQALETPVVVRSWGATAEAKEVLL